MNTMFLCCLYVFLMPSLWNFSFLFCFILFQFVFFTLVLPYLLLFFWQLFAFFMKNRKGMDPDGRGREKELGWLRGSKNIIKIQQIKNLFSTEKYICLLSLSELYKIYFGQNYPSLSL